MSQVDITNRESRDSSPLLPPSAINSIVPANSVPANSVPANSIVPANSVVPANLIVPANSIVSDNSIVPANSIPANSIAPANSVPANSIPANSIVPSNSIVPANSIAPANSIPANSVPTNSIAPANSVVPATSPEIPILEDYPPEILKLIFSRIGQHEIKLVYPNLAPYYLPMKYRTIDLFGWFRGGYIGGYSVGDLRRLRYQYLNLEILPPFLEAEWFRPERLNIHHIAAFREYPTHLLKKIKYIEIMYLCEITEEGDYERLFKMENIIELSIRKNSIFKNKNYPIPKSVLHAEIRRGGYNMEFPQLRTLTMSTDTSLNAWPQLTKLILNFALVDFLVKFPVSLVHLEFTDLTVPEYTNLDYLINLRTLYIRLIKNIDLPKTIRRLYCCREIDFTQFHHLEYVNVVGGHGFFSFPNTIRELELLDCKVFGLDLSELKKLESLIIDLSEVDMKQVEFPQGLKKIQFTDLSSTSQSGWEFSFHSLPRRLEEFKLRSSGFGQPTEFKCAWPESVRRIELERVYIKSLACPDTIDVEFIQWPLQLEHLALKEMNVANISRTNIAKLNLKVFELVEIDSDALRTTNFGNNSPNPSQKVFTFCPFELSGSSFTGSTLSKLVLYSCEIHASSSVQLPSTLRVITITKCDLTSEMWSNFICPPDLKSLDLLDNKLTAFVKCPPKLETLNLKNNKLTTCGKINACTIEVALEGNKIPTESILEFSALVAQGNAIFGHRSKRRFRYGRLFRYDKIEGIGLVYTIRRGNRCYNLVVTKSGVRRFDHHEVY